MNYFLLTGVLLIVFLGVYLFYWGEGEVTGSFVLGEPKVFSKNTLSTPYLIDPDYVEVKELVVRKRSDGNGL